MRFTRLTPSSSDELRDAILEDLESLVPGMRCVATRVPVSGRGVIDLYAADERGRLAVVSFCLEASPDAIAHVVDQWDWTVANMGLLRALVSVTGLDLTLSPRVILVCESISETVRRFAACLPAPGVEIFEATIVAAGERRGLLIDRLTTDPAPVPAGSVIDTALEAIASDETRALTRRLLEELRATTEAGVPFTLVPLTGAFDIRRDGKDVASLGATAAGLTVRWIDPAHVMRISDDTGCGEAVRHLASGVVRPEPPPMAQTRNISSAPAAAALTPEEVAEFERLRSDPDALKGAEPDKPHAGERARAEARHEIDPNEPPAVRVLRTGFMEN